MGLGNVRRSYGVPAYRGAKVTYRGEPGAITSSDDSGRLRIRLDVQRGRWLVVHPKDEELVYLEPFTLKDAWRLGFPRIAVAHAPGEE